MNSRAEFIRIYEQFHPKVFRLCKGFFNGNEDLAADYTQEIFIKIWEKKDSFKKDSNVGTWIYRISVNMCLMQIRKEAREKKKSYSTYFESVTETYDPEHEHRLKTMYECIHQLKEKDRLIILMVLEKVPYSQITEVIGISEESLRVTIHRIKKKLTSCAQHGKL
ncbi:RNA polymerase sigma factor [Algoriphagus lacus]|uniref:RNA polymerase sigma factor n=1 Tax=Algoriphagus lacus TaxID=2056311 RepID=A0A418PNB3_9BACT|nr:RNA polymerase sigma factor [Algoriphagus lacus]RIW13384.1 RNA polymerase sigma factor [Algoriphagus lacus]